MFKKEKHCDRTQTIDKEKGDQWDHTAIDAENCLIISVVLGRRTLASCVKLIQAVKKGEKKIQRTPAMAAGLTDHIWAIEEWVAYPMIMSSQ